MPISTIDGCDAEHWAEVLKIVKEAASNAGFESSLVSDSEESGIIQKRIVSNLYNSDLVIADVSGKNPNVMFELGMRLAFDKPTIIIKDSKTNYSFDTGIIEHVGYPRDLHYYSILEFKDTLSKKIKATHNKATTDATYTTFLGHFGEYTVANLEKTELGGNEFVLRAIDELRSEVSSLSRRQAGGLSSRRSPSKELVEMVNFFIKQYALENQLDEPISLKHESKLFSYLEEQDILREAAEDPDRLRLALRRTLSRMERNELNKKR